MPLKDIYGFGKSAPKYLHRYPTKKNSHVDLSKQQSTFNFNEHVVGAIHPPRLEKQSFKRGTYTPPKPSEFSLHSHVVGARDPPSMEANKSIKKLYKNIPGGTGEDVYKVMHWH